MSGLEQNRHMPSSATASQEVSAADAVALESFGTVRVGERPGERVRADLVQLGRRIRELRTARNLTLQSVAEATGLSISMISAVERGRANPSIGTLIAIADVLGVSMVSLFDLEGRAESSPVSRREDQPVIRASGGFERRLVVQDRTRGIELAYNTYREPGAASNPTPSHHSGFELGLVLEGELEVYLDGRAYRLRPGDGIAYPSTLPHRSVNVGGGVARTVWVNLYKERS